MKGRSLAAKKKGRLFVTTGSYKLKGFTIVKSLKGVDWTDIEGLIFNSSEDDDLTVYSEIVKVKDQLKFVIYINSDIKPIFFSLFSGIDGDIYKNSDLLNDETIIDFMITKYGKTGLRENVCTEL